MFDINTYFLNEQQMNIIKTNVNNKLNSIIQSPLRCIRYKRYGVQPNISFTEQYNVKYKNNIIICKSNKSNSHNVDDDNKNNIKKTTKIDKDSLLMFTTVVFSSVMVLSTCIVMILCARETNMEATNLQEKYDKLYEEVKHLEEKNVEDEFMIGAIVDEIIKLKSIGII